MYKDRPEFQKPSDDAVLWRYMDFMKFISLLDRKALFFARGDTLDDPFEGSLPKANAAVRRKLLEKDVPEGMLKEATRPITELFKRSRTAIFVNCWHDNDHESAAMWKLYARDNGGVAVRTRFSILTKSFIDEEDVYVGKVKYIDYDTTASSERSVLHPFMYKRPHFEYEQEVRATMMSKLQLVLGDDSPPYFVGPGTYARVDLDQLIEEVVISPYAEDWLHELIYSVTQRYGLKAPIRGSSLSDSPTWE